MSKPRLCFILPGVLFILMFHGFPDGGGRLLAQEDSNLEVGGSLPLTEGESGWFPELNVLDARLALSAQYNHFTGEDMRDTYGGLPMIAAAFSFRASRYSRVFVSVGYGKQTGDPYYNTPGINAEDHIKVRYLPVQWGMKADLARSTRIHVYIGAAVELAWMEETIPLLGNEGTVAETSSTGINGGYNLTFGPEFVLGQGGRAVGLEIGWGGSKGSVTTRGHSHQIDMTGFRGRLYLALAL
ncbi:MAG: hypothetical protein ABFS42_12270 [Candidatus Krumholzibacteriota bacterium]